MPVAFCGCTSTSPSTGSQTQGAEYQDKKYGKGYRVHSGPRIEKGKRTDLYYCTVCGAKREIKTAKEEAPKK